MKISIFIFFSFLCWLALSGNFDKWFLLAGFLLCIATFMLSYRMNITNFSNQKIKYFALLKYFIWLSQEIMISGFMTAILIFKRSKIKPVIISLKPKCKSYFNVMLMANSITLTPGTVSLYISMDKIIIHALNKNMLHSVHIINQKICELEE